MAKQEQPLVDEIPQPTQTSTNPRFSDLGRILVIVPTYNERENLEAITARVRRSVPEVHVLIADDNSPDGTGAIADRLSNADGQIHVLHRLGKDGLGAAYLAGFQWGLEHGFDVLVEMDADGSHKPEELHLLLDRLRTADLVLGSRWVDGGEVVNWPKRREILSRGGNLYTRMALQIPIHDATGGYRAFRATTLRSIDLHSVGSAGYIFQVDLAYRAALAGLRVAEVPITFEEREFGTSKMHGGIVREALWRVTVWGFDHRLETFRKWRLRRGRHRGIGW
jgi:dolichol-phosphate mannosyltransferase